ncbi:hypothetical protein Tcan_07006 [Toxocara canis]|uniref:Uncharacterized protein n=1 Tax=Toxocara canis TaxID=6265 RepID=A0A0B2VZA1_TOXCA|nr:hypothetical protein Tcan_07006 [Toxocara canis]
MSAFSTMLDVLKFTVIIYVDGSRFFGCLQMISLECFCCFFSLHIRDRKTQIVSEDGGQESIVLNGKCIKHIPVALQMSAFSTMLDVLKFTVIIYVDGSRFFGCLQMISLECFCCFFSLHIRDRKTQIVSEDGGQESIVLNGKCIKHIPVALQMSAFSTMLDVLKFTVIIYVDGSRFFGCLQMISLECFCCFFSLHIRDRKTQIVSEDGGQESIVLNGKCIKHIPVALQMSAFSTMLDVLKFTVIIYVDGSRFFGCLQMISLECFCCFFSLHIRDRKTQIVSEDGGQESIVLNGKCIKHIPVALQMSAFSTMLDVLKFTVIIYVDGSRFFGCLQMISLECFCCFFSLHIRDRKTQIVSEDGGQESIVLNGKCIKHIPVALQMSAFSTMLDVLKFTVIIYVDGSRFFGCLQMISLECFCCFFSLHIRDRKTQIVSEDGGQESIVLNGKCIKHIPVALQMSAFSTMLDVLKFTVIIYVDGSRFFGCLQMISLECFCCFFSLHIRDRKTQIVSEDGGQESIVLNGKCIKHIPVALQMSAFSTMLDVLKFTVIIYVDGSRFFGCLQMISLECFCCFFSLHIRDRKTQIVSEDGGQESIVLNGKCIKHIPVALQMSAFSTMLDVLKFTVIIYVDGSRFFGCLQMISLECFCCFFSLHIRDRKTQIVSEDGGQESIVLNGKCIKHIPVALQMSAFSTMLDVLKFTVIIYVDGSRFFGCLQMISLECFCCFFSLHIRDRKTQIVSEDGGQESIVLNGKCIKHIPVALQMSAFSTMLDVLKFTVIIYVDGSRFFGCLQMISLECFCCFFSLHIRDRKTQIVSEDGGQESIVLNGKCIKHIPVALQMSAFSTMLDVLKFTVIIYVDGSRFFGCLQMISLECFCCFFSLHIRDRKTQIVSEDGGQESIVLNGKCIKHIPVALQMSAFSTMLDVLKFTVIIYVDGSRFFGCLQMISLECFCCFFSLHIRDRKTQIVSEDGGQESIVLNGKCIKHIPVALQMSAFSTMLDVLKFTVIIYVDGSRFFGCLQMISLECFCCFFSLHIRDRKTQIVSEDGGQESIVLNGKCIKHIPVALQMSAFSTMLDVLKFTVIIYVDGSRFFGCLQMISLECFCCFFSLHIRDRKTQIVSEDGGQESIVLNGKCIKHIPVALQMSAFSTMLDVLKFTVIIYVDGSRFFGCLQMISLECFCCFFSLHIRDRKTQIVSEDGGQESIVLNGKCIKHIPVALQMSAFSTMLDVLKFTVIIYVDGSRFFGCLQMISLECFCCFFSLHIRDRKTQIVSEDGGQESIVLNGKCIKHIPVALQMSAFSTMLDVLKFTVIIYVDGSRFFGCLQMISLECFCCFFSLHIRDRKTQIVSEDGLCRQHYF